MKTKVVYVVVSGNTDFYLEQALISISSLRLYNNDCIIQVVTDIDTLNFINKELEFFKSSVSSIVAFETPTGYNNMMKSRYLKTNLRNLIDGDFLFIDTDTVIVKSLKDIDSLDVEMGAVADSHVCLDNYYMKKNVLSHARDLNFYPDVNKPYINSGILYVKDMLSTRSFFSDWHKYWIESSEKGIYYDQLSLAKANQMHHNFISILDGEWNCQVVENGLKFLDKAYVIHYFASGMKAGKQSAYLLYDMDIYKEIRLNKGLTNRIKKMIASPKSQFSDSTRLISGNEIDFLNTYIWKFCLKNLSAFRIIEKMFGKLVYIRKSINKIVK